MNKKIVSSMLTAVVLASSGLAMAQPGPGRGPDDHRGQQGPGPQGKGPQGQGQGHGPQGHGPQGQGPGHDRGRSDAAPGHWSKGQRVPDPYRGRQYVIEDWRGYQLRQPPRGYHWIGVGADYFLIGVATGVVLESVLGR